MSPAYGGVWAEWFGDYLGRGVGNPTRAFIESPEDFVRWAKRNEESNIRSYVSVQPFKVYEKPVFIEKLFFDFDCEEDPGKAGDDAFEFKRRLKKFYNIETIPIFSGNKGYHIYPFLAKNFGYGLTHAQLRDVYKKLMEMLVGSAAYETIDKQVFGDIVRLARLPYSRHEKTGKLCTFVDEDRNPIMVNPGFTKSLREHGLSFELCKSALYKTGHEAKERREQRAKKPRSTRRYDRTIRPCFKAVLDSGSIHSPAHIMKVAAVAELNANGWGPDRIIDTFMRMSKSNERKTSYFVMYVIRAGYKPFRCTTIQSLEGCLGSECAIWRRKNR